MKGQLATMSCRLLCSGENLSKGTTMTQTMVSLALEFLQVVLIINFSQMLPNNCWMCCLFGISEDRLKVLLEEKKKKDLQWQKGVSGKTHFFLTQIHYDWVSQLNFRWSDLCFFGCLQSTMLERPSVCEYFPALFSNDLQTL